MNRYSQPCLSPSSCSASSSPPVTCYPVTVVIPHHFIFLSQFSVTCSNIGTVLCHILLSLSHVNILSSCYCHSFVSHFLMIDNLVMQSLIISVTYTVTVLRCTFYHCHIFVSHLCYHCHPGDMRVLGEWKRPVLARSQGENKWAVRVTVQSHTQFRWKWCIYSPQFYKVNTTPSLS